MPYTPFTQVPKKLLVKQKKAKRLHCAVPYGDSWPLSSQISLKEETFHGDK